MPCIGAVLHTLNIRLFPEQLAYIVNHAADGSIIVGADLVPLLAKVAADLPTVEHYHRGRRGRRIVARRRGARQTCSTTTSSSPPSSSASTWPDGRRTVGRRDVLHERHHGEPQGGRRTATARRCLHSDGRARAVGAAAHRQRDRVLAIVPMFHANAWGMPVRQLDGRRRAASCPGSTCRARTCRGMVEEERPRRRRRPDGAATTSSATPIAATLDMSSLAGVMSGGSAVPPVR